MNEWAQARPGFSKANTGKKTNKNKNTSITQCYFLSVLGTQMFKTEKKRIPATVGVASIVQTVSGSGSGPKIQAVRGSTNHYYFPFGQANQNGCTLLVFHNMKTHPDVPSAIGMKSVFETFLVDPQNLKNQNC